MLNTISKLDVCRRLHCFDIANSFVCINVFFADVDECINPSTCGKLQQCFNIAGSYLCECILGYENDPRSNTDCIGDVHFSYYELLIS